LVFEFLQFLGKKPSPFIPESVKLIKEYSEAVNGVSTSFVKPLASLQQLIF
jgi:hypothetical protein